jgi:hypothetical protein
LPIAITSSVELNEKLNAEGFITNVDTPLDCVKLTIAVFSINCPLQKKVKLSTDVAGRLAGAVNHPDEKVIVTLSIKVPVNCLFVFKYVNVVVSTVLI